jgi:hypothetical protein
MHCFLATVGRDSSVGIETGYALDGPGIESRWGRSFPHLSRPALVPTQPSVQWYRIFPGVKSSRGVTLTSQPLLVPWSWMSRAIPLLPVWVVRPVQSLNACTRVTFTFYLPASALFWFITQEIALVTNISGQPTHPNSRGKGFFTLEDGTGRYSATSRRKSKITN